MRLDLALVHWAGVASRTRAQDLISQGRVRVDGKVVTRVSTPVAPGAELEVEDEGWVSRAAHKLLGAMQDSGFSPRGRVLDAGASTGGFTQVLLRRGCEQVYAVDVGHDQLDPGLRADPRVVVREGLNLRDLTLADLDGVKVDAIVADVSFISLKLLLGPLRDVLAPSGAALLLVKPQFEVGRESLGPGGVVRDPSERDRVVAEVAAAAGGLGLIEVWRGASRLPGPAGNVEIFLLLELPPAGAA